MAIGNHAEQLGAEQRAFDAQIEEMLQEHAGEFVIFHDERPVAFHSTYSKAYGDALRRFGSDGVFLVSEVKKRGLEPSSIAWEYGLMFAEL